MSDSINNQKVFTAQIRALYCHIPMVLIVNVINSGLVAVVLASYSEKTVRWGIFYALVLSLTAVRAVGWKLYPHPRRIPVNHTRKWAVAATIGSGLSGLLWGAASTLLLPDNIVEQTFFAFVIGGMCAGALVSLSYYLPAFIAYAYFALLPLCASFLLDGQTVYVAMGCMGLVFAAALTFAAYQFNQSFVSGVRLNLDLSAANQQLQEEIAHREATENKLHQSQKMEVLGQLTGGIAHDFNNLLTAVIGNLELAHARVDDPDTTRLLETSLGAAERGATLIRDLLTFARRNTLDPKTVDVSGVVADAEKILKQTIGPSIRLTIQSESDLRRAWVDPNQLALAVVNLALNARDAMPHGGHLQIVCEKRQSDGHSPPNLDAGDYVIVSVSDTGTGMDKATLAHVFEPFYTTKQVGHGSGLGLSMVQGFAVGSGGMVQIATSLGKGTTVEIWLPQAEGHFIVNDPALPGDIALEQGRASILVCDDDGDVRSLIVAFLRDIGYTVRDANNPVLALQILQRERHIDLLVVDYAMPEMNGAVVIDCARSCQPGIKTLLITGHADILRNNGILGSPFLAKPFKLADLGRRIAEILNEASPQPGHVSYKESSKCPV